MLNAVYYHDGEQAKELETRLASLCRFRNACNEEINPLPSPRLRVSGAKFRRHKYRQNGAEGVPSE